jgi:hypothetical protein
MKCSGGKAKEGLTYLDCKLCDEEGVKKEKCWIADAEQEYRRRCG